MQHQCHPDLPEGSPFAHPNPFQDWIIRKSEQPVPYDVVILCKDGHAGYNRLFVEHKAEFAVSSQPTGYVFFRIADGRFVVITADTSNLEEMWPALEVWNWWDEGEPDLETLREKEQVGRMISGVRYH